MLNRESCSSINCMNSLQRGTTPRVSLFLLVYGLGHALVDASSAFLVLGVLDVKNQLVFYVVLYNALAFALQAPLGFLLDTYPYPRHTAIVGLLFVCAAYFCLPLPLVGVILVGVGNALFHVGGGQVSLNINSTKATYAGIFVAPGGIGLALGIYLALSHGLSNLLVFPVSLLVMSVIVFFTKLPTCAVVKPTPKQINYVAIIIMLCMVSITIRSVIGLTLHFPWKSHLPLLILLTLSVALGKALGGVLADRFGWIRTGIIGLLLAIPLLTFGASYATLGLIGVFLFNFTMPITLVAISNALPGRAGFSFGLTTVALFIGAIPTFTHYKAWFSQQSVVITFILLATVALYFGLRMLVKQKDAKAIEIEP